MHASTRSRSRGPGLPALLALALATGLSAPTRAADRYWACGSDWWDYTCWSGTPGGAATLAQPQAGDNARLLSTDIFGRTVSFWNTAYPAAVLNSLTLDGTGGGLMTLVQERHTLAAIDQTIAVNGRGTYNLSAGTNQVTNQLTLGWYGGSQGTYNLSGTGNLALPYPATEVIGLYGRGSFNQSGGTHSAGYSLTLAQYAGSQGSFVLSAGSLTMTGGAWIGQGGSGSFTQTGGTHSAGGGLSIGREVGSSGVYLLSGGDVSATNQRVGYAGTGTFSQSGGANALASLYIGELSTGSGSYSLGGSGTLNSGVSEDIGYRGNGSFSQSGGTHNAHGNLNLGWFSGSSGSYDLSGTGALTANIEVIGYQGSGSFVQSGGTHTAAVQILLANVAGSQGSYTLGGGSLSALNLIVGRGGSGSFTQGGGSVTVGNALNIGDSMFGGGSYTLNAGSLAVLNEVVGAGGSSSFIQAGGTHAVTNSFIVATGSYTLAAGSLTTATASIGVEHNASSVFTQTGGVNVGTYETSVGHDAPFGGSASYLHSGGTHSANALLIGNMYRSTGSYTLSGSASLSAQQETIGYAGSGSFSQTGGSHVVANDLRIGYYGYGGAGSYAQTAGTVVVGGSLVLGHEAAASGGYDLGGGSLRAASEIIGKGGSGSFAQAAGSHEVVNYLTLGELAGSQGSYALGGSGNLKAFTEVVGYYGSGSFTQTGGANVMISKLLVGYNSGSVGSYVHSGGSNRVNADLDLGFESGASGSYALSGSGVLDANVEHIGWYGSGSFAQSGGTHSVGTLLLGVASGGSGSYTLSGGTLNLGGIVGTAGSSSLIVDGGTLNFQGASITLGALEIGRAAGANGSFALTSGQTLAAGSVRIGVTGAGAFTQSGGTHTAGSLLIGPQGSYTLAGGTLVPGPGASNAGTLVLRGGQVAGGLTVTGSGNLRASDGAAVISGPVVNEGAITVAKATLRFAGGLDNQGAYFSDSAQSSFSELTVDEKGYFAAAAGDRFVVSGDFGNASRQGERWDTAAATLVLDGTKGQTLSLAGSDEGAWLGGLAHNFAWGMLSLAQGASMTLVDGNADKGAALYVGVLELNNGLDQLKEIHSPFNIYYDPRLQDNEYLDGRSFSLDGEGRLIPMQAVPEAGGLATMLAGLAVLGLVMRRRAPHA